MTGELYRLVLRLRRTRFPVARHLFVAVLCCDRRDFWGYCGFRSGSPSAVSGYPTKHSLIPIHVFGFPDTESPRWKTRVWSRYIFVDIPIQIGDPSSLPRFPDTFLWTSRYIFVDFPIQIWYFPIHFCLQRVCSVIPIQICGGGL